MKIIVNEIPTQGLSINESFDAKEWELDRQDIEFVKPVDVEAFVLKDKQNLSVEIKLNSDIAFICSRCLKEFKKPLEKAVKLFIQLKGENSVDVSNDIRENIILDYPIKVLCGEACKGLCSKCGQDLNEKVCSCN